MKKRNPNELPDPDNPCEVCATHGREARKAVIPTVHLNGSGAKNLKAQYKEAIEAVSTAINTLPAPHARDYYVQEDGAFEAARKQFSEQVLKLEEVREELKAVYFGIANQERAAS